MYQLVLKFMVKGDPQNPEELMDFVGHPWPGKIMIPRLTNKLKYFQVIVHRGGPLFRLPVVLWCNFILSKGFNNSLFLFCNKTYLYVIYM